MKMKPQPQLLLIGESFSPWTKKARWALEYCGLSYSYQEYTPTLSEPRLRWQLKQVTGSVSVPVLIADHQVIRDSWQIAHFANETAGDGRLGNFKEIEPWNNLSETALAEGRTRVVRCIHENNQALEESLPTFIPPFLRSSMRFVARDAVKRLDKRYAHLLITGSIHQALTQTRKALAQSNNDYLLGDFSFADITMAVVPEVIAPIAIHEPPLGQATTLCWSDLTLSDEFQDILEWRNRLAKNTETSYSQFRFG